MVIYDNKPTKIYYHIKLHRNLTDSVQLQECVCTSDQRSNFLEITCDRPKLCIYNSVANSLYQTDYLVWS